MGRGSRVTCLELLKRYKFCFLGLLIGLIIWLNCLPDQLFARDYSTVVYAKDFQLLSAQIAKDEQWRFPEVDSVPYKFKTSLRYFEDEYFYTHPGFNPVSIAKALKHNMTQETRLGASTITQQVIRLSRGNKSRTYLEKATELALATRLELSHTKDEILKLYASHAPFGGNVVGLPAASWRYYGLPPHQLSWGQAAALAVLPNSPSIIFPGKNKAAFKAKRDRLLKKLFINHLLSETDYQLALLEQLPEKPKALPQLANHFLEYASSTSTLQLPNRIPSSIDYQLQHQLNQQIASYYKQAKQNQVYNAAILVLDVKTNQIRAYVANTPTDMAHDKYVDLIQAKRSVGSLLKPFLHAFMLEEGQLLPEQLVQDIPTSINNYEPQNFDKTFRGMVSANTYLQRSLNVPAVRLLQNYGLEKFHSRLKQLNINNFNRSASYYGLTLILGGGESSLWEMTSAYAGMARSLNQFNVSGQYPTKAYQSPTFLNSEALSEKQQKKPLGAGAIYKTFEALKELKRPGLDGYWKAFANKQNIAWKTGTSYGFKDAWAIGVNPDYAVGVWVGNADGTGRPGLVGVEAAAPLLFTVFDALPASKSWFLKPYDDLKSLQTCAVSGFLASLHCPKQLTVDVPSGFTHVIPCPFHQLVNLSSDETYQVNSLCDSQVSSVTKPWFNLPPVEAFYYAQHHPEYQPLPAFKSDCSGLNIQNLAIIYPQNGQELSLPRTMQQQQGEFVIKAAASLNQPLYWYLDNTFLKTTSKFHELNLSLRPGTYRVTIVNNQGQTAESSFSIIQK